MRPLGFQRTGGRSARTLGMRKLRHLVLLLLAAATLTACGAGGLQPASGPPPYGRGGTNSGGSA